MATYPPANSQKKNSDPGEHGDIFSWPMLRDVPPGEDASEHETTNEDLEQILAQCYRIARARARQSHLAINASSVRNES